MTGEDEDVVPEIRGVEGEVGYGKVVRGSRNPSCTPNSQAPTVNIPEDRSRCLPPIDTSTTFRTDISKLYSASIAHTTIE
jgi:hypothetical protein